MNWKENNRPPDVECDWSVYVEPTMYLQLHFAISENTIIFYLLAQRQNTKHSRGKVYKLLKRTSMRACYSSLTASSLPQQLRPFQLLAL